VKYAVRTLTVSPAKLGGGIIVVTHVDIKALKAISLKKARKNQR